LARRPGGELAIVNGEINDMINVDQQRRVDQVQTARHWIQIRDMDIDGFWHFAPLVSERTRERGHWKNLVRVWGI
jgi:hypothetical protein